MATRWVDVAQSPQNDEKTHGDDTGVREMLQSDVNKKLQAGV